jgi:hypothetical protein
MPHPGDSVPELKLTRLEVHHEALERLFPELRVPVKPSLIGVPSPVTLLAMMGLPQPRPEELREPPRWMLPYFTIKSSEWGSSEE